MPKITLTREDILGGPLNEEQYELLLSRGELLAEATRWRTAKYMIPLIDKRVKEIEDERNHLGLLAYDPVKYAETVRDCEAEIDAQLEDERRLRDDGDPSA